MAIPPEDIERVRAATDLVAVVSEHVALRRVGTRWVGLCPFHAEKTGSFSVNAELGFWYCFGCHAKGDAITFMREVHHLDFVEAVEALAGRAGIKLRHDGGRRSGERRRREALVATMASAVDWYHRRLLDAPDAAPARAYLRSRGYDGDVVRRFRLGWAPRAWDALCRGSGLAPSDLKDTGLALVNRRGRLQDSFRARVLFPIYDHRGDAVALGGRELPGGEGPKYKNSPATSIYDKSTVLYGLNWAKADLVTGGQVVVCEGYTDVIALVVAGVTAAVATCGTAVTDRHVATLRSFAAQRIVLAFDADAAGQGAAERFYEWERRHGVDLRVAALAPGTDPADLGRADPAALRAAVEGAVPMLAFRLDRLLGTGPARTPEERARLAEAAGRLIAEHPSQIVREEYAGSTAARLGVRPEHLAAGQGALRRRPEVLTATPRRRQSAALMVLGLAVQQPASVADLLDESLFSDDVHRAAYRALGASATLHEAIDGAEPEAAELLQRLAVEELDVDPEDVVALLVAEAIGRASAEIRSQIADDYRVELVQQADWLRRRLDELRATTSRREAVNQLVAWLASRTEDGREHALARPVAP